MRMLLLPSSTSCSNTESCSKTLPENLKSVSPMQGVNHSVPVPTPRPEQLPEVSVRPSAPPKALTFPDSTTPPTSG